MLANEDVDVIGHDRAGIAGQLFAANDGGECRGDLVALVGVERENLVVEARRCLRVKLANLPTTRLNLLSAVVNLPAPQDIGVNHTRALSRGIVGAGRTPSN